MLISSNSPVKDDGFSDHDSFDCISSPTPNDSPMSTTIDQPASEEPVYHPRYYVKDDMTVFLVNGKVLFRVHRYYLDRESDIFRSYRCGTDESPVPLDVLPHDFEALLEYFYDSVHDDHTKSSEEWTSILSLATQFKMEKVRNRAIRELEDFDLDPVDKIDLAVNNDIPAWLKPAFVALCQREEPICEEEAKKLGWGVTMKLARAREKARENSWVKRVETIQKTYDAAGESLSSIPDSCSYCGTHHPAVPTLPLISCGGSLDPAQVEDTVENIFWPASPISPEGGSSDSAKDVVTSKASGGKGKKKCKKCRK